MARATALANSRWAQASSGPLGSTPYGSASRTSASNRADRARALSALL